MAKSPFSRLTFFLTLIYFFSSCVSQNPSTNIPVPPLQWIDLTGLTSGAAPPGLKYASIGFDSASGTVLIFGGESNGIPGQQTYLLNTSSLTWSIPSPPNGLFTKPPARSAAISGGDFAASNRHGHVVIGGIDINGNPLADAWEFDYNNQFWTEINISPGGPGARYFASGGIDPTSAPTQDNNVPGPNNTFYLAGGSDNKSIFPLSDVWKFEVAGVLSPNLPNNTLGSWSKVTLSSSAPSRVRQGGTVMPSAKVVAIGGCNSSDTDNLCAQQDATVLDITAANIIPLAGCPAPRVGPAVIPNLNGFSTSFGTQVIVILGTFNNSLWNDGDGLNQGEVDVFDTGTGTWARILPAGDPGTSNETPRFPTPREGAVAISSSHSLVGTGASGGADILVFGGQDAQGNYLNDLWLLRTYAAAITSTNESWAGFGDGSLSSGVDASGSGVKIQYMTACATALSPTSTSSGSGSPTPSSSGVPGKQPDKPGSSIVHPFDTHIAHKILSPLSIAALLAALLIYRLSQPSLTTSLPVERQSLVLWSSIIVGAIAYIVGIVGVILSFTTLSRTADGALSKRGVSSSSLLKTGHGKAGLAFFIGLYAVLAVWIGSLLFMRRRQRAVTPAEPDQPEAARKFSDETGFSGLTGTGQREKLETSRRISSPLPEGADPSSPPESPMSDSQSRKHSFFSSRLWPGYLSRDKTERHSSESARESVTSSGPARSFEVLNRGTRVRRLSANGLNGYSNDQTTQSGLPRTLSDLDWLDRRRSVAAVGDLDYALTQLNNANGQGLTPPGGDNRSTGPLLNMPQEIIRPILPSKSRCLLHTLIHIFILGSSVVALVALWQRAPIATFVVFLIWTLSFYAALFFLAWRGIPKQSVLTVLVTSLKDHHHPLPVQTSTPPSRPLSTAATDQFIIGDSRGPYSHHQPPYHRALATTEEDYLSSHHDDDIDEDEEQRRIEQEMERRDVSIITVPKRKLWVVNPS